MKEHTGNAGASYQKQYRVAALVFYRREAPPPEAKPVVPVAVATPAVPKGKKAAAAVKQELVAVKREPAPAMPTAPVVKAKAKAKATTKPAAKRGRRKGKRSCTVRPSLRLRTLMVCMLVYWSFIYTKYR